MQIWERRGKDVKEKFYGVYAALMTPFDKEGKVDEKRLKNLVSFLMAKGLHGFYVCGGTGEGLSMDVEERKRVLETVKNTVKGKAKIITHVGTYCTKNAIELARHAEKIGADAVSSLPPLYYKYSDEEILSYYRTVASSTNLPLFLYYIPATTGISLANEKTAKLRKVKNIVGLKYTHPDFHLLQDLLIKTEGKWIAFSGPDELFLPALTMGAVGSIGSSQNVLPEIFLKIYENFMSGNIGVAMELQKRITIAVTLMKYKYGGIASWKAALKFRGVDVGYCRPPLKTSLSFQREEDFKKDWKRHFPEFVDQ